MKVAVSIGDPLGIGPEVTAKALRRDLPAGASFVVHMPRSLAATLGPLPSCVSVLHVDADTAGAVQLKSLVAATQQVIHGACDALCTAPITKSEIATAGFSFPGHTEYLADACGAERAIMMLAGPQLRVIPMTGHIPLRDVPNALARVPIADIIEAADHALRRDFDIPVPRLAVVGLNPHAGESGMFGDEERLLLQPAVDDARRRGVCVSNPLPADGLFATLAAETSPSFHCVLCCYHDQALIPLKARHRHDSVNVTLGLPIVRTSPAHGSARDIAGRGVADPHSMWEALRLAVSIARRRGAAKESSEN